MTDEYQEYKLFAERMEAQFPKMFDSKYGGFACGKGWWPMLEQLCGTIQSHIDWKQKQGQECPQVVVEQIKEKFGTLRFYYQGGDDYIHGAVALAENLTGHLCEECGSTGTRRSGGWIRTLCDVHEFERQSQQEKYAKDNGLEM
jgi:hypothetical protein